jgi:TPR repeat protein
MREDDALDRQDTFALPPVDATTALSDLRRAARSGDIEAQVLLAQALIERRAARVRGDCDAATNAHDDRANDAESLHWFTLAANEGHAVAMNMVGRCHELGRGTAPDASLAAAWYRKAAEADLDWGLYNYAQLLAAGRGVKRDRARALALYRRAAAMGHAKSMNLVGRFYDEGWEVDADRAVAIDWYRRAAEGGDFRGQVSHASVLAAEGRVGEATTWLERAIETATPAFLAQLAEDLSRASQAEFRAVAVKIRRRV